MLQTESKTLSKMIARRQELGGALIYNELRFNYHTRREGPSSQQA